MLLSTVDVIFADVAQPDQARIVGHNAHSFLKDGGHAVISIKASCIDSTIDPDTVFANEVEQLMQSNFKPLEQVTLEPYERDHAMVSGTYYYWPRSFYVSSLISFILCSCLPTAQKAKLITRLCIVGLCRPGFSFFYYLSLHLVHPFCWLTYVLTHILLSLAT